MIDAATSHTDFQLSELRRKRQSIYVGVKRNQLGTLAPLLSLLFQQCLDVLGRDIPAADEPHHVLLLIDEFASLGRMRELESAIGFLAGYHIRMLLIVQGLGQIQDPVLGYGEKGAENILQNAKVQVYYAANDDSTANHVSKHLGTKTIAVHSRSDQGGFRWSTKSTSYAARQLMLPEQVRQLDERDAIIFKENARPVRAKKILYYRHKAFRSRLMPPLSVPALTIEPIQPRAFEIPSRWRRGGDSMPEEPDHDYEDLEGDAHSEDTIDNTESAVLAAAIEKLIEEDRQSTEDPFVDEAATTTPTGSESS